MNTHLSGIGQTQRDADRDLAGHRAGAWLTLEQAAERVSLHPATLRRAIKAGRLRAARVNNARLIRIRENWLDAYLANSEQIEDVP